MKAHYPLAANGVDLTGNYDSMRYGNHLFIDSSILSKGCARINDTCLIETPQIDAMNNEAFAIEVEFKMIRFGGAIVQAGKGYRYLGLATTGTGNFGMKTGSQIEDIFVNVQLVLDQWYSATILHNTADSVTEVYLDGKFIVEKKQYLDHPSNDNIIANIDFSRGFALSGYLRNLKVYSGDNLLASVKSGLDATPLVVWPNPATSAVRIDIPIEEGITYTMADINGRVIEEAVYQSNVLSIDEMLPGLYFLSIYNKGYLVHRGRFIKE